MKILPWSRRTETEKYAQALRVLAEGDDLRAVGPLADALEFRDKEVRRMAEAALVRLLPLLQETDADLLDTEQRDGLNRALSGKNAFLIRAILRALERVGDWTALPHVERLARNHPESTEQRLIQRAAQECLPFLLHRLGKDRKTLLRATTSPLMSPDALLRASHAPCVPADALRQPTENESPAPRRRKPQ